LANNSNGSHPIFLSEALLLIAHHPHHTVVHTHRYDGSSGSYTYFGLEDTIEDMILLSLSTWPTMLLSLMNALLMTWREEELDRAVVEEKKD
jgi:hypothetical protein